jgi:hypothetical protein
MANYLESVERPLPLNDVLAWLGRSRPWFYVTKPFPSFLIGKRRFIDPAELRDYITRAKHDGLSDDDDPAGTGSHVQDNPGVVTAEDAPA